MSPMGLVAANGTALLDFAAPSAVWEEHDVVGTDSIGTGAVPTTSAVTSCTAAATSSKNGSPLFASVTRDSDPPSTRIANNRHNVRIIAALDSSSSSESDEEQQH